jgi:alginate O-acetyltransferase complex protein AlgI
MSISSTIFMFAFLPATLAGYYLINPKYRNVFLLVMSLLFYAWGEPKFVLVLIASIFINYLLAILIEKFRNRVLSRLFLITSLIGNVSLLFVFKYLAWTIQNLNGYLNLSIPLINLALPLGISFFTFRSISYILDVYFETSKAQKNPLNVGLYITFFPQLSMGPITQYSDFEEQISNRKASMDYFSKGIKRLIIGLAKKMIIANAMGLVADKAFGLQGAELSVSFAWLGIIAYCFQLFFDFSGYSDMAIGLGNMFGFDCAENFNFPYISKSIGEYWRRWHMTLGNWLKVYIYTPIIRQIMHQKNPLTKKNFGIQMGDIIALFVVWLVCGMWHGSGWKFVVWGMYYFFFIAVERLIQERKKKIAKLKKLPAHKESFIESILAHVYALIVIIFGQVLFRAASLTDAVGYMGNLLGLQQNPIKDGLTIMYLQDYSLILIMAFLFSVPLLPTITKLFSHSIVLNKYSKYVLPVIYIAIFIIGLAYMVGGTYNSFIYFKF